MRSRTARQNRVTLVACFFLSSQLCRAQAPAPTPSAPRTVAPEALEDARLHYERGVQLYGEADYGGALVEMERAYAIAPSSKILFNVGRVERRLNDYAAALSAFQRYLVEEPDIPEERRREVQREIETLKPRVATIDLFVNIADANTSIDDIPLPKAAATGARTLTINAGRHKVEASKPGYYPESRYVTTVSGDIAHVSIELKKIAPEATSEVDSGMRNRAIAGWSLTGVLALGAGVVGLTALSQRATLIDDRGARNIDPAQLDADARKLKRTSIVADSLGAAAIVAGGVSIYLTTVATKREPSLSSASAGPSLHLRIAPAALSLHGSF